MIYIENFYLELETASYAALTSVLACIPAVIGFFKVLWISIKSFFKKPENYQYDVNSSLSQQSLIDDEFESENNNVEKKHKIKQSIFDPCGIINQFEYFNFLDDPDVNHFASFFRLRKCKVKMIPGLIILFIVISYAIIDFIAAFDFFTIIFRIPFYIISLPFLMIFNISSLIMDNKKMKERHSYIRIIWIFVSIGYLLLILVGTVFIIIVKIKFNVFVPTNLIYTNSSSSITTSEPSSVCETKYYGLSLLQYAGLASAGQIPNITLANEIAKYIFDGFGKDFYDFNYFYLVPINETFSVIVFNSINDMNSISFLLENYFIDFIPQKIFSAIIPFFEMIYDLIIGRFMNIVLFYLNLIAGVPQITQSYIELNKRIYNATKTINNTFVYTGHSVGGLLAKGVGTSFHASSVSFESLNHHQSLFNAGMSVGTLKIHTMTNGFQMINVYSPSQLFAQVETNSTINIKLPKWKGILDYINPYEVTCLLAAGCATDERYDGLCDAIIGLDNYKYLFTLWNRTRSDYIMK